MKTCVCVCVSVVGECVCVSLRTRGKDEGLKRRAKRRGMVERTLDSEYALGQIPLRLSFFNHRNSQNDCKSQMRYVFESTLCLCI